MSEGGAHAVVAREVSRVYGRQRALSRTTLTLDAGEAVALLGPNGAGKSTLCGILAGLVRPSTGQVTIDGHPARQMRGAVGLCAHESLCYGDLSGRENLAFFASLYALADPAPRVAELLERVGLAEAAHRPARTYSRGMVQRLALARALLHRPRLLILDEPFTGLDRGGVERAGEILRDERRRGTILLVVSHDLDAVAGLCTRVVLLQRGQLAHDGPAPADGDQLRDLYRAHTVSA